MVQLNVTTSSAPEVVIEEITGSLQLKGWSRPEVLVKSEGDITPVLEEQDDVVTIRCNGDCLIRLPHEASVKVESVHGEAIFKLLDERLQIEKIMGSLVLRNVAETRVESVEGELVAKQVLGDLNVDHIAGNVVLRDVQGCCTLERVSGNLDLRDAEGDLIISAGGNANLRLSLLTGERYEISADGNLNFHLPADSSARLNLTSRANTIRVRLPEEQKLIQEQNYSLTLQDGQASINLTAGGTLSLDSQAAGWMEMDDVQAEIEGAQAEIESAFTGLSEGLLTEQIEAQLEAHMQALEEHMSRLSEKLEGTGVSEAQQERIMRRAREASERATARAQEKMRRTQEKLERKMAAAERKAELKIRAAERISRSHGRRSWSVEWPPSHPRAAPQPPKEPVADEERLMILRMLEEKKISLDEAEKLLSSLEGNA
ncbi:MAG TPA: hypothetical protein VLA49_13765 [Anaerolineales bacterium]|nr:hypothetical protein [Anaerolineales bacterium]